MMTLSMVIRIRIRIRIYLLARRNLLWDILRLPSSRRAALGLYMSFSRYDEDGARTSHHTHCCIGARRATHCANQATFSLTFVSQSETKYTLEYSLSKRN